MTAVAPLINDYIHQIAKRDVEIAELRKRVLEVETAWAAALCREREAIERARAAEEELCHLERELGEDAD